MSFFVSSLSYRHQSSSCVCGNWARSVCFCLTLAVLAASGVIDSSCPVARAQDLQNANSLLPPSLPTIEPPTANGATAAAEPEPPAPTEQLDPEAIRREMETVLAGNELEETVRTQVETAYQEALRQLESAQKFRTDAQQYRDNAASIEQDTKKLEEELASLSKMAEDKPDASTDLETLKQQLAERQAALEEARKTRDALEAEAARRTAARRDLPAQIETARTRLAELTSKLQTPPSAPVPALARAQLVLLQSQWINTHWEIEARQAELEQYTRAADALFPLRRRVAEQRVDVMQKLVDRWQEAVSRRTEQEAQAQAARIEQRLDEIPAALRPLAETNKELADEIATITARLNESRERLTGVQRELERLKREKKELERRLETVGMNRSLGLLLRLRRAALPEVYHIVQRSRSRQEEVRDTQWRVLELADEYVQRPSWDQELDAWVDRLPPADTYSEHLEQQRLAEQLLKERNELYDRQLQRYNEYLEAIVELDNAEHALVETVEEYRVFIDEHVFWIRSVPPLDLQELRSMPRLAGGVLRQMVSLETLRELGDALRRDVFAFAPLWALGCVVFLAWVVFLPRIARELDRAGQRARSPGCRHYWVTAEAFGLTILRASLVPAVLAFVAWRLGSPVDGSKGATAASVGLWAAARFAFLYSLLIGLCCKNGLGEAHFGWTGSATALVRRHVRWFLILGAVLLYAFHWIDEYGDDRWMGSAGRLAFLALYVAMGILAYLLLRPNGRLFRAVCAYHGDSRFYRFRRVLYLLAMSGPAVFVVLALLGYLYTAGQLSGRFHDTVFLPIGLTVLAALFSRWVLIRRRTLAIARAIEKREAAREKETTERSEGSELGVVAAAPQEEVDLAVVSEQTVRLFHGLLVILGVVGVWLIWSETLPALAILKQVDLWHIATQTTSTVVGADGTPLTVTGTEATAITLADVAMVILALTVTWIIARNMAGVMQIAIPQTVQLDSGLRYAIATLANYTVVIVGVIVAFNQLGIGWSQVQWLVAALGVGLGFGLQEIFANFVSGLIILFERPVRVGDLVTINGESGVVSKIHIRATTILNFERRELIVPNKALITGDVLNWTLSNPVNRLDITVGVAYGSDTDRVTELLREITAENPNVMDDPAPLISFDAFNDSTLNFTLRCYLPNYDNRLATMHQLFSEIHRRFNAEGIEIAFPQHDLHIRSIPEGWHGMPGA